MTDCNIRGLMAMSNLQACTTTHLSAVTVTRGNDQFFNLSDSPYEGIQNIQFNSGSKIYNVYLTDDKGNLIIFLGTTNMCIFANSSIPTPSEPYYNLKGSNSFHLSIPNCEVPLRFTYESVNFRSDYASTLPERTKIPYYASIQFRSDQPFIHLAKDDHASIKVYFKDAYTYEVL